MSVAGTPSGTLRLERAEASRLAWAFGVSLLVHLLLVGGYYAGQKALVWYELHRPAWLQSKVLDEFLKRNKPAAPTTPEPEQPPLLFVEVSPAQATPEPPKDAKYYSDKNSQAANPDTSKDTNLPEISGKQTEYVRTEDVPRKEFTPLQPVPPAPKATEEQPEVKAKPTQPPGDLTMAKPDLKPRKEEGETPLPRPRTLQEAYARQPDKRLAGQKMKQEGGVRRHLEISSLDAKATPCGAYDYAFIQAVQQRWFALLDEWGYTSESRGKVILRFVLHYDGRITDMETGENTAGEVLSLLCEKAIRDPAPYARFTSEMRHEVGDTRNIQFTFFYN